MSEMCEQIHRWFSKLRRFRFPFDPKAIPANGIYVLFENGENAHGGDRIVRVGTHTGVRQLPSRLKQHFLLENKDRSIFRKNIGRALLAKAGDPFAANWELDLTTSAAKQQQEHLLRSERQQQIERDVSRYIQTHFSFGVVEVQEKAERLRIESRIISTVSLCSVCTPSPVWLGLSSPKAKIRESGLWLVNELYKQPLSAEEFSGLATRLGQPATT